MCVLLPFGLLLSAAASIPFFWVFGRDDLCTDYCVNNYSVQRVNSFNPQSSIVLKDQTEKGFDVVTHRLGERVQKE